LIARLKHLTHSAKTHQGFRRYFANTSWMFAEQMLRMVAGLLVGIWVARYLGPEQFGVFSYAIAFASLFSSIAKLGLGGIVVRDLVKEPEQRDRYLGTAFWLKLMGAILMLGIVAIAMQLSSSDQLTNLYILIIASGAIFQSFEVVDFYFQSKVLSKFVSICKMTQLFISSLLKLYFIFTGAELIYFVLITLVDQITLSLSLYIAYRFQKLGSFYGHFNTAIAKRLLKDSWPLIFSGLLVTIYMRIDQIMIKEMLGAQEVGLFAAAVRLSEVWYFIPSIITASLFPSIVNAKKNSQAMYLQRLQKLSTLMTWLAIVIALPMTFASDLVVSLLYGHYYQGAGAVLAIHIWGAVFVFLGVASGVFFTVENYTKKSLYRTSLGALSNILLNLVLIPRYGINGAATATLLSQFIANFLYDFFDTSVRDLVFIKIKALFPIYYIWSQENH
jgi:O-antigen/teichoic acid export membrane protein